MGEENPYNPFKFEADFTVNVLEEGKFEQLKEGVSKTFGVQIDDILAVEVRLLVHLWQGCVNDDKTILGGRNQFMSHFCTLFNFNICYANMELKALRNTNRLLSDDELLTQKLDEWARKFDDIS